MEIPEAIKHLDAIASLKNGDWVRITEYMDLAYEHRPDGNGWYYRCVRPQFARVVHAAESSLGVIVPNAKGGVQKYMVWPAQYGQFEIIEQGNHNA